jgi:hypothetical protein
MSKVDFDYYEIFVCFVLTIAPCMVLKKILVFIFSSAAVSIVFCSCQSSDATEDDASLPVITSIVPESGFAGDTTTINGNYFTGADSTKVVFPSFSYVVPNVYPKIISISKTELKIIIPSVPLFREVNIQIQRGKLRSNLDVHSRFTVLSRYWDIVDGIYVGSPEVATFVVGKKGYILGSLGPFSSFDTETETFITLPSFAPYGLRHAFATDSKGIAVVDGVIEGNNDVWEFDPLSSEWTQKSNCPFRLHFGSFTFRIGSKVYMSGGSEHEFVSYDGATDTWTKLADYPGINGDGASAIAVDGIGYCFQGGYNFVFDGNETFPSFNHYNGNWKYDPEVDQWTKLADGPDAVADRIHAIAVAVDDNIYFGGGYSQLFAGDLQYLDYMYNYSIATDSWTKSVLWPYHNTVEFGHGFAVGDKAYLLQEQGAQQMYIFKPKQD